MAGERYRCEVCGAEGLSEGGLREHVMTRHLVDATACPYCDLGGVTAAELLEHVDSTHLQHRGNINNNDWGRSHLALNLRPHASDQLRCPLCSFTHSNSSTMEEHINRRHFDLTSPSLGGNSEAESTNSRPLRDSSPPYTCPLCVSTFQDAPDLELHVNVQHKDILSPANGGGTGVERSPDEGGGACPICYLSNFTSTDALADHIEHHFTQKGMSPVTPDMCADRLLAKEMERRDKEVQRLREQHEFQLLRAQYGMDNEGNFRQQSLTNMQRAVYSGELSVADYYERQVDLKAAESAGIDDSTSCTPGIVALVRGASETCGGARLHLCSAVDHYASTYGDRGWGCGYRNIQMVLSSLIQDTGYNEAVLRGVWGQVGGSARSPTRCSMPSISKLQGLVERAWSLGFDTQGSDQLGGSLVNTRKWIGATELVTLLSSLRISCELVDFHRPTSPNGGHPQLFSWVLDYFQSYSDFKPPLYLQHQGHSRTIVGVVEEGRDGGPSLLVLDPSHSPRQMSDLACPMSCSNSLRLITKGYASVKAKQYQVVAITGLMQSDLEYQRSKVIRSERIPRDR